MKKILILCFIVITAWAKSVFGKERPNILFVFIDDLGYGDLGCYGNKRHETPHIDRLANEGVRFSQFYVNAPICSPSRVAVTTGQYPSRWGITSFINDRKSNEERGMKNFLELKAPSLARNMQESGYYTAHIGKWHMGGGRDIGDVPYITEYGFNESVTQFEGIGERYLATYETLNLPDSTRNLEKMSAALGKGEIHWIKREDFTEVFVDRTIRAIDHALKEEKPFYINLWPDDVHTPLEPPRHLRGNGKTDELYRGVIQEMDAQLARLFDYIRNHPKLKDNTLIILSGDNGPAKNVGSPDGLRGSKGNLYEGGIREPLIVWGPALVSPKKQGTVNSKTVLAGIDLFPSIIAMTGAKETAGVSCDGIDASRALLGYRQPVRKKSICWQRPPGTSREYPDLAIREGDYKLLVNTDGTKAELYNIRKDEAETTNLAGNYPNLTTRLKKKVLEWYSVMPPLVQ
ncbi:sulfatase-like hydrolase/transferase [Gaoshiqia sp. Z1-71]|uniref:sulfatase-like hydrolase/transferase n=1 Tax=Gaoshiqia hydrogeniformans TaxID=3290090 RepID=UPI003BF7FCF7